MMVADSGSLNVTVSRGREVTLTSAHCGEFFEPNCISVIISLEDFSLIFISVDHVLKQNMITGNVRLIKKDTWTLPWGTLFCYRTLLNGDAGYLLHRA